MKTPHSHTRKQAWGKAKDSAEAKVKDAEKKVEKAYDKGMSKANEVEAKAKKAAEDAKVSKRQFPWLVIVNV